MRYGGENYEYILNIYFKCGQSQTSHSKKFTGHLDTGAKLCAEQNSDSNSDRPNE